MPNSARRNENCSSANMTRRNKLKLRHAKLKKLRKKKSVFKNCRTKKMPKGRQNWQRRGAKRSNSELQRIYNLK